MGTAKSKAIKSHAGANDKSDRYFARLKKDIVKNRYIYLMLLPVLAWYICFCYIPIYGIQIAFKNFTPGLGIMGSPWAGLTHFKSFFAGPYFTRTVTNTILISFYSLVFSFPSSIILALLLNEVKSRHFKKVVQTVSYLPHFISTVVICGIIREFTASNGLIGKIVEAFGGVPKTLLIDPSAFRPIYIISDIWQGIGWGSIIYLAALSGIDPTLYDAAAVDGAGRFRCMVNITIPGILPTIVIMFILRVGNMMSVGWEKIILLYNENIYSTADVISSYVYRKGLIETNYSYSAAVGVFNSVINYTLVVCANKISRKLSGTSLW